jgi:hypothetical protein
MTTVFPALPGFTVFISGGGKLSIGSLLTLASPSLPGSNLQVWKTGQRHVKLTSLPHNFLCNFINKYPIHKFVLDSFSIDALPQSL